MKATYKKRLLYLGALLSLTGGAEAAVIGCNTDATPSVLAVNNALGAYCVSDYGWSNTWYSTGVNNTNPIPSSYDQALDLFSGDDAVNLRFGIQEGTEVPTIVSGNGWLTPTLDAGALFPFYPTGSLWQVIDPVSYTTPGDETATQSKIRLPLVGLGNVDVTINTKIFDDGKVQQLYTIQNNADVNLVDILFTDYFNFHPNGSLVAETKEGTTAIGSEGVTTTGNSNLPSFIGNGNMVLIDGAGNPLTPSTFDIGCADVLGIDLDCLGVGPTIPRVEAGSYNGVSGPLGPGDYAAALAYGIGFLAPEESFTIGVMKRVVSEPGTLGLLGLGLLGLAGGLSRISSRARPSGPA